MRRSNAVLALLLGVAALPAPCAGAPAAAPAVTMPAPGTPLHQWTDAERQGGFRHFDQVLPSRVVKQGGQPSPLPAGPAIAPRFEFDGLPLTLDEFIELNHVSGLIAVKDGKVVLERYAYARKPEDRWVSFSVTKSVTSLLIGAALKDGRIRSLEDKVTRYLPAMKGSAYEHVSLRHLLQMRSGVAWNENYADPGADVWKVGMLPPVDAMNPTARYMKGLARAAPPGRQFLYNTGETDLAGLVLSAAVGKPLSEYLSGTIWAPFGMESDALWPTDTGKHERGGCCLNMTLRDYARLGLFALGGGKAGGAQVVPADWMAQSTRAYTEDPGYGYFWWIRRGGAYAALGIHGQAVYVFPREQLVVAVNSAWPAAWDDTRAARQDAMADAIAAHYAR